MAEGGDVFLVDVGEPVRIKALAEQMVWLSGLSLGVASTVRTRTLDRLVLLGHTEACLRERSSGRQEFSVSPGGSACLCQGVGGRWSLPIRERCAAAGP